MKSNINVTIDSEILERAKEIRLNVSGVCNDALKEAVGEIELTPEQKAMYGMAKQAEDKERLLRSEELVNLRKKIQTKYNRVMQIISIKGAPAIAVYKKTSSRFPGASAFRPDIQSVRAQLDRLEYALPLLEKVSPEPPSKKSEKNAHIVKSGKS